MLTLLRERMANGCYAARPAAAPTALPRARAPAAAWRAVRRMKKPLLLY